MASALQRPKRNSMDSPPTLSDLSQHAASFIKAHTDSEPKMRPILEELQRITAKQKKKQGKVKKGKRVGILTSGVVSGVGLVAAPFTAGFSLIIAGVAGVVAVSVAAVTVEKKSGKHVTTVQTLVDDLLQDVKSLTSKLEEIKNLCEALKKEATSGSGAEHIMGLETQSVKLLDVVASLQEPVTADCVMDRADQCEMFLDEFGNMKTQLEAFRESRDTENTPTD